MRPATQASGTEGTQTGTPPHPHAERLGFRCLAAFRRRIVGRGEGKEDVAPARENSKLWGGGDGREGRGQWKMEEGSRRRAGRPGVQCNADEGERRRTCAMGLVVGGRLSPPPP